MIANYRMYSVAPAVDMAWRRLLERLSETSGVALQIIDYPAPAPLAELWAREDCACVFMCGLPFIRRNPLPQIIAAPVPAAARYGSRPIYFSEFLVPDASPYQTLADTFDLRLACMLPESNSGFNAPRHHLALRAPGGRQWLYHPTASPTPTPLQVIHAVLDGSAEVGVVDSYLLDLLRAHRPELMESLRTIDVTEPSPIPLFVAGSGMPRASVERLAKTLCAMHLDQTVQPALECLMLERFVRPDSDSYLSLLEKANRCDQQGFYLTKPRDRSTS